MSLYTKLKEDDLNKILSEFSVEGFDSYKVLSGGSENTNYGVFTENGNFVLTICEQKSKQELNTLAQLLEHLAAHNFRTSEIIYTKDGNRFSTWNEKPVMLKIFLEGRIHDHLSDELMVKAGVQMAKLHKVPAPDYLTKEISYGQQHFKLLEQYAKGSDFEKWLIGIMEFVNPFFSDALPKAFIHSDIFASNLIVSDSTSEITIMDFEEAANYYRVFDIGMAIIGLCAEEKMINFTKAKLLLKGYESIVKLNEQEKDALPAFTIYAGACMTFWRHKNFNYVNPNPSMSKHYLGLKVLVDHVKSQEGNPFF